MTRRILLVVLLLALTPPCLLAQQTPGVLYQFSTIDALMSGLYDGELTIRDLLTHGDFGLGTFDRLNGEMVALDGRVYQITSDGVAHVVPGGTRTPFAAVTYFHPGTTAVLPGGMDYAGLLQALDRLLPSRNLIYAIRIEGRFDLVKTRSVPAQNRPYPRLTEVVAKQPTFALEPVTGTIVGFRCPYYVKSVNVPGYHLHFLDDARKRGGHLLDCRTGEITVSVEPISELRLTLPTNATFRDADLQPPAAGALERVEKGK